MNLKIKRELEAALKATKRPGMPKLLEWLVDHGFYEAPCSGGNHMCCSGGLAQHSLNVYTNAHKIAKALLSEEEYAGMKHSITIVSILHDIGKLGAFDEPMYVENVLKNGKQSAAKPYKRNPMISMIPHAMLSLYNACENIKMTKDEFWAIGAHDGLYDYLRPNILGHETKLLMIVHWADMWASKVDEAGFGEEDNDE